MSLYKRLHEVQSGGDSDTRTDASVAELATAAGGDPPADGSGQGGLAAAAAAASQARTGVNRRDPVLDELRQRIHHSLIEDARCPKPTRTSTRSSRF